MKAPILEQQRDLLVEQVEDYFLSLATADPNTLPGGEAIEREAMARMEMWAIFETPAMHPRVAYRDLLTSAYGTPDTPAFEQESGVSPNVADFMFKVWEKVYPRSGERLRELVTYHLNGLTRVAVKTATGDGSLSKEDHAWVMWVMRVQTPPTFPMPFIDVRKVAKLWRTACQPALLRKADAVTSVVAEGGRLTDEQVNRFVQLLGS